MGLDMFIYLHKEDYKSEFRGNLGALPPELKNFHVESTSHEDYYEVGYWRKFNALHSYIVETYANGIDECQKIYLTRLDIKNILSTLKLIKDEECAKEYMPTSEGFFFGSTDYDDYYFENVKKSIDIFSKLLAFLTSEDGKDYDVFYNASW